MGDTHIEECEDDPLHSPPTPTYMASATEHVRIVLRNISLPPHKFKKTAKGISGLHPR